METETTEYSFNIEYKHRITFTREIFNQNNNTLHSIITRNVTQEIPKALLVVDEKVTLKNPLLRTKIVHYFQSFAHSINYCGLLEYPGGETLKNDRTHLKDLYQKIEDHKLCRHSFIMALGGGALLDMVGFVSATAHRGILHIRIPTTSLSQGDGGVGVKNGINLFGKKNFVGAFAPPFAVINDTQFLETLSYRQLKDGYIEALKVALIRDPKFFQAIETHAPALIERDPATISWLIKKSAQHHIQHITESGDPFERKSVRPLDFGHWVAHRLESLSNFAITHGEAVAIGIAVDVVYSHLIDYLPKAEMEKILALITHLGFECYHPLLIKKNPSADYEILSGLDEFREHLGGRLSISLLRGIGNSVEVSQMDKNMILQAITLLKTIIQESL